MLKLYNTLTQKKQEFHKKPGETVSLYVCGITPYDKMHVGHARCYVVFDVLCRYLRYKGYVVRFVQNFTDIDDKIIHRAQEQHISISDLAEKNIENYFKNIDALNIQRAQVYPRVTEHIPQIIDTIKKLVNNAHAYVVKGSVYYDISTFPSYGALSHRNINELIEGVRIEHEEGKKNPLDFALWKAHKPGEPAWDSPWGTGRPGWHIECSTMSTLHLGETIDIHGGGQDLIFPHHENEIAQSEGVTAKPFVKLWIHNGFVTIDKQKMSKSLGNFFTLDDVLQKYHPMALRLFLVSQHYRSPLDFSDTKLEEFSRSYQHLRDSIYRMNSVTSDGKTHMPFPAHMKKLRESEQLFFEAMDDDINTGAAVGELFTCINFLNELTGQKKLDIATITMGYISVQDMLENVLGITMNVEKEKHINEEDIKQLIQKRQEARKQKDFATSDRIREQLVHQGVVIEDTPSGTRWWKKQ